EAERAATIYLDTALGRVLLDGPITLANGARRHRLGAAHRTVHERVKIDSSDGTPDTLWYESSVEVAEGDPVVAVGLRRARRDGAGYREAGTSVLSPAPAVGSIRLATLPPADRARS